MPETVVMNSCCPAHFFIYLLKYHQYAWSSFFISSAVIGLRSMARHA